MSYADKYLELSSRIKSYDSDGSSDGASCNTFVVQDRVSGVDGISDMLKWCTEIPCRQGAPTIILSNIRGKGQTTSRGVTTNGATGLALLVDHILTWARRPNKKNSAGVAFIDADHSDINEWISQEFTSLLKTLYLGVLIDPRKKYSDELLSKLAEAYDSKRIFINKLTFDSDGNVLYPNVCNEIRQPHKGTCTLAAIKLHEMADLSVEEFGEVFADCAEKLISYLPKIQQTAKDNPFLYSFSRQVGLGFVGMSNFLGKLGTTYQEAVEEYQNTTDEVLYPAANRFWGLMAFGLFRGYLVQEKHNVERMFTSQPTAHTALRLSDGTFVDSSGTMKVLSVVPELAPVIGGTRASDGLVRVYRKSSIATEKEGVLTFPSYVQTQDEVPYKVYREFCECLLDLMDSTISFNCDRHTFSHTYYDDTFELSDLKDFLTSNLDSLYYRLEPVHVSADKTQVDDVGDISDLLEDDEEAVICPINPQDRLECESCSM